MSVGGRSLPQQVANAINVGAAVVRGRLPPSLFFSFSLQAVCLCVNGGAGDAIASFPDTSRHGDGCVAVTTSTQSFSVQNS